MSSLTTRLIYNQIKSASHQLQLLECLCSVYNVTSSFYFPVSPVSTFVLLYIDCMVTENIHTPTTEGSSLMTPPPPPDFSFFQENGNPPSLQIFHKYDNTAPHPIWKVYFFGDKILIANTYSGHVLLRSVNIYCQLNVSTCICNFHSK